MGKTEITSYKCGCGKVYSSYPAFSNHKKNKHDNHNQPGTSIPKPYNPKRGRPSFTIPQKQNITINSEFSSVTCVEIGLLSLSQEYKGILSNV
jgi:hypothetical protein